ncbi:hypothetical protein QAD02_000116 [Eretmocerus hayati]|uniref:Uncharacterized protein n=1 Tax=Eretmocerus hayati TaxID=131215 RepID=A0ACC2NCQ5_9HYME|nr:hypothetical protein QAD02_000116 [Eretmocerus hayati]
MLTRVNKVFGSKTLSHGLEISTCSTILIALIFWSPITVSCTHEYPPTGKILDHAFNAIKSMRDVEKLKSLNLSGAEILQEPIIKEFRSFNTDVSYLKTVALGKTRYLNQPVADRVYKILTKVSSIQHHFEDFLNFYKNYGDLNLKHFIDKHSEPLQEISSEAMEDKNVIRESMMNITHQQLIDIFKVSKSSCTTDSAQQMIYKFFRSVISSYLEEFTLRSYINARYIFNTSGNYHERERYYDDWLNTEEASLRKILGDNIQTAEKAIRNSSQTILPCAQSTKEKDDLFMEVQAFRKYVTYKVDENDGMWNLIVSTCPKSNNTGLGLIYHKCDQKVMRSKCYGSLTNCEQIGRNSTADVCFAPANSGREYNWIEVDDKELFGRNDSCASLGGLGGDKLHELHMCSCERAEKNLNRHFSLAEVTSDLNDNKVITGARLIVRSHIFHIQIKQKELGENGLLHGDDIWKEIDDSSLPSYPLENDHSHAMIHTITRNKNTIVVGETFGRSDEILTGFRFTVVDGKLELQTRVTSFDFLKAKLDKSKSRWVSVDSTLRKEIKFVTSDLVTDLGQRTMPLLYRQEVGANPPIPLTGGGLSVREDVGKVQYIGLWLRHLNLDKYF